MQPELVPCFKQGSFESEIGREELARLKRVVVGLSRLSTGRTLSAGAANWIFLVLVMYIQWTYGSPYTYLLALILISSRQQGLLVLMHEGAHYRISNNKTINDLISDIFFCSRFIMVELDFVLSTSDKLYIS